MTDNPHDDHMWISSSGAAMARCMDCGLEFEMTLEKTFAVQHYDDGGIYFMCEDCAERVEQAKAGRNSG